MLLPQAALVPVTTPVEAMNTSSRNKITKGGLRQAQARYGSAAKKYAKHKALALKNTTEPGPAENPEKGG
ncbi:MAG: hypothetical protein IPK70_12095 [Flavobacteriales bacterium]|nr:hypothetical protein [Flavobacteriales bacterium]